MNKTSSVFVRVEPEVKVQAELILNELGIPMSNAIALFLKQVVLNKGIPFDIKLPVTKPIIFNSLSDEQFNTIIEKGIAEFSAGNTITAKEVHEQMNKELGLWVYGK